MSAPTVAVDVCNLTLDLLKQAPITSLDTPEDPAEVIFARWYDTCRRSLLRAHTWNFGLKRRVLTVDSTAPAFGYSDAYNLPNDFIRIASIGDDSLGDFRRDYQIENGQILMTNDAGSLNLRYVYDITLVTRFDPLFVDLLALYMAVRLSNKFNIASSLKTELKEDFKTAWANAMSIDGQERPPVRIQTSKVLARRQGRGTEHNSHFVVFPD